MPLAWAPPVPDRLSNTWVRHCGIIHLDSVRCRDASIGSRSSGDALAASSPFGARAWTYACPHGIVVSVAAEAPIPQCSLHRTSVRRGHRSFNRTHHGLRPQRERPSPLRRSDAAWTAAAARLAPSLDDGLPIWKCTYKSGGATLHSTRLGLAR